MIYTCFQNMPMTYTEIALLIKYVLEWRFSVLFSIIISCVHFATYEIKIIHQPHDFPLKFPNSQRGIGKLKLLSWLKNILKNLIDRKSIKLLTKYFYIYFLQNKSVNTIQVKKNKTCYFLVKVVYTNFPACHVHCKPNCLKFEYSFSL